MRSVPSLWTGPDLDCGFHNGVVSVVWVQMPACSDAQGLALRSVPRFIREPGTRCFLAIHREFAVGHRMA